MRLPASPPAAALLLAAALLRVSAGAFAPPTAPAPPPRAAAALGATNGGGCGVGRREFASSVASVALSAGGAAAVLLASTPVPARAERDSLDVEEFLRSGADLGGPMGVSSQAGKSRPETGVVLRDGSGVNRDSRSGDVLAEIVLGPRSDLKPVLATFSSPWPLATGSVFDVECRDGKTGDGAFLAVTTSAGGRSVADLPPSFFLDQLFSPAGRFSFYGSPTDIKVKRSAMEGNNRVLEVSFSNLSQSTQTEIPRVAVVSATIPEGTDQAVMLVGSATASRWRRAGSDSAIRKTVASFRAVPAPKSGLKVRAKEWGA